MQPRYRVVIHGLTKGDEGLQRVRTCDFTHPIATRGKTGEPCPDGAGSNLRRLPSRPGNTFGRSKVGASLQLQSAKAFQRFRWHGTQALEIHTSMTWSRACDRGSLLLLRAPVGCHYLGQNLSAGKQDRDHFLRSHVSWGTSSDPVPTGKPLENGSELSRGSV